MGDRAGKRISPADTSEELIDRPGNRWFGSPAGQRWADVVSIGTRIEAGSLERARTNHEGSLLRPLAATGGSDEGVEGSLGIDQIFEVLKNERRRAVLELLVEVEDPPLSLGEVSVQVAALENDKPASLVTWDERKRVYVGLLQIHLPKMDSMDIVDFDKSPGTIEPGAAFDEIHPFVSSRTGDGRDPWPTYFAAAAVVVVAGFPVIPPLEMVTASRLLPMWILSSVCVEILLSLGFTAWYLRKGEHRIGQLRGHHTIWNRLKDLLSVEDG